VNIDFEKCTLKKIGNKKIFIKFNFIQGEITNKLCKNEIGIKIKG
tara:strand:+ start:285 stop:419 length:135 start_codon:yes stop_codon:yes gene_type:complete